LPVARGPLEDLAAVPLDERRSWLPVRPLGGAQEFAVVPQQRLLEAGGAVRLVGHEQHAGVVEREDAQPIVRGRRRRRPASLDRSLIGAEFEFKHLVHANPALLHLVAADRNRDAAEWNISLSPAVTTCDARPKASPLPQGSFP
jgi:hypothetical protein